MSWTIEKAAPDDAAAVAAVRMGAARDLTMKHGLGTWSFAMESEDSVRAELFSATVLIVRAEGSVLGTVKLALRSPYLMPISAFTAVENPIWLTAMNVLPRAQGQGIGRALANAARKSALEMGGEAIRLDSYDANAGAGGFWRRCGFREVGRMNYNGTPLIFFEDLLVTAGTTDSPRTVH
jgi:GNAT superfamily N-acetyltransferase